MTDVNTKVAKAQQMAEDIVEMTMEMASNVADEATDEYWDGCRDIENTKVCMEGMGIDDITEDMLHMVHGMVLAGIAESLAEPSGCVGVECKDCPLWVDGRCTCTKPSSKERAYLDEVKTEIQKGRGYDRLWESIGECVSNMALRMAEDYGYEEWYVQMALEELVMDEHFDQDAIKERVAEAYEDME